MDDRAFALMTAQSEVGAISRLVLKHVRDAFQGPEAIAAEWRALNFTAAPDFARAIDQYEAFLGLLRSSDCEIVMLPKADGVGLDSIYVRMHRLFVTTESFSAIWARHNARKNPLRRKRHCTARVPILLDRRPANWKRDVAWLNERTSSRPRLPPNDAGIARLVRSLVSIDELLTVPPHWRGAAMSFTSCRSSIR
jgi:hypothetical protein